MDKHIPKEHFPFGEKVEEIPCPRCGGSMYCIGMVCWCDEHEDFVYKEDSDGFKFYCKGCNGTIELTINKWNQLKVRH